jgi:hypothetical protein
MKTQPHQSRAERPITSVKQRPSFSSGVSEQTRKFGPVTETMQAGPRHRGYVPARGRGRARPRQAGRRVYRGTFGQAPAVVASIGCVNHRRRSSEHPLGPPCRIRPSRRIVRAMPSASRYQLRIASHAAIVAPQRHAAWVAEASATPGLSRFELAVLDVIAEHHRRACRGSAARLSLESLGFDLGGSSPRTVSAAINRLVGMGLLGVRPGNGRAGSQYLPALPRSAMVTAALAAQEAGGLPWPATSQC